MSRWFALVFAAGLVFAPRVEAAPALPAELALTFCWDFPSCGESRLVILEEGRFFDVVSGDAGSWSWDPASREFVLEFDLGTVYTGRPRGGRGCLQGEMVSFYGDEGVWRACVD